ncbi:MAG: FHA domain-containing protein [Polyangiaceae bacterium]|nr:FHA domain-containing protein [Polyangiaceae bacterium]
MIALTMVGWLRDESGVRVPLDPSGTVIGRSSSCTIVVDDPEVSRRHVLVLHADGATQVIPLGRRHPAVRGVTVQGPTWVQDGDELVVGRARFAFEIRVDSAMPAAKADAAPSAPAEAPLPTAVAFERVPNGALLRVTGASERTAFLPSKRADLVAALLHPTTGAAGEWIEDDVLCASVWGDEGGTRVQLNTLLHRTRASLTEAGLDGARLLERAPGGGAVRFLLAPNATVSTA